MGAEDLIANDKQVAIIEYHSGDSYSNSYGSARLSYYNLSGTPTAWFDGGNAVVGGYHSQSMYSSYLPKYNQRIAINSSFTIQVDGSNVGDNYSLMVILTKVSTYGGPNPILHLALTQSNIAQSWQGLTELNFVERLMVPNQNGSTINFTSGDVQVVNLSFTKNAAWPLADCEIVAFLQNNTSKEILQAIKLPLNQLMPLATDAALVSVYNVPVTSCLGKASPYLKIKNNTTTNLVAATIKYKVNDEELMTYNWIGSLGLNQETFFQLPQMTFSPLTENLFTAFIFTSNGTADPNHENDTVTKLFMAAESYYSTIKLELITDNNPHQTKWQVLNANDQVVFSGGPYTGQPNTLIQEELEFQQSACYKFIISDSGNDGICCSSGNGSFSLTDINNQPIYSNGNFGPKETVEFGIRITIFNLQAYIEGPFVPSTYEMNTILNQQGSIPLNQPYNSEPWNYFGNESVISIPGPNIVDWVLIELRETTGGPETATSSTIVSRQAAFLNHYGEVVSFDGQGNLKFNIEITENLFIVLHHRNHLSMMNNTAIPISGGIIHFDFSASPEIIYGGNAGCKDIVGLSVMAAGDANGDGIIDNNDLFDSWENSAGNKDYLPADLNLNQQVDNTDKNGYWKINYLKQSQVPQ